VAPGTTPAPSAAPSSNVETSAPGTSSPPTPSDDQNTVRATPFSLTYILSEPREPNVFEYAFAADVALVHLETFLKEQFSSIVDFQIEDLQGMIIETGFNPVTIDFSATVIFSENSSIPVTQEELNMLIELAFLAPQVDTLIEVYRTLPPDEPFSTTQSIEFSTLSNVVKNDINLLQREQVGGKSTTEKVLIAGLTFLSLLLFTLVGLWYRSRRRAQGCPLTRSKFELIPIMPAYSYCDTRSSNLMQFKDETFSATPDESLRFKARSNSSSMSSHSSSVVIRAV
jgi:hypothetical protein